LRKAGKRGSVDGATGGWGAGHGRGGTDRPGVAADFFIDAKIVGAGGSQVEIAMTGGGQRGDYAVRIVPVTYQGTQYTWAVGRYLLFLAVTRGADQGQTVCSVFVH